LSGLTATTLLIAYALRGLPRSTGWVIIALYALFVVVSLATTS
jgi:hypothetical protein